MQIKATATYYFLPSVSQYILLVWLEEGRHSYNLLVKMQNGAAIIEENLTAVSGIPTKISPLI